MPESSSKPPGTTPHFLSRKGTEKVRGHTSHPLLGGRVMFPSSPHLRTRWLWRETLGVLRSTKWMRMPCLRHRSEKALCSPVHLLALGLPMVALAMALLHHPPTFVPHALHRLFQELVQFGRHSLVVVPDPGHHLLSIVPELTSKSHKRWSDLAQHLTGIPEQTPNRGGPILVIRLKLIGHFLKIFCDMHFKFHLSSPPFL